MKKKWILFRKLMHQETGVDWNPIKNLLDAFDKWWERKIKENSDYSKFKNEDLSLIWFRYDTLFSDVAATGERAQAPSQRYGNEIDSYEEMLEDNGESNNHKEEQVHIGDSDDTKNIEIFDYNVNSRTKKTNSVSNEVMFPYLDNIKRKFSDEKSKGKKKISGAASLKEDIHSLLYFMTNRNTETSTPSIEITIGAAIELLNNVPGIAPQSELWNYLCNLLSKNEMREVFVSQPCHGSRLSWLEFNYNQFKKSC
ncbi:hypothetical protein CDL12_00784 [Handroanthus impetiginosus]|uniref:Myb/SANT-like domain-containing protein n=1 Tax=Handroanthus impetiginosus TaxID=429701 RepID=A0A2G9I9N0_9LAMI|nr:hypothetical protein CDL12_00784 [Handroanthus impetiginosus]